MASWKDTSIGPANLPPARTEQMRVAIWWDHQIEPARHGCGMVRCDGILSDVYLGTSSGVNALLFWENSEALADLVYWEVDEDDGTVIIEWPDEKAWRDIANSWPDMWAAFTGVWDEDDLIGADFDPFLDATNPNDSGDGGA